MCCGCFVGEFGLVQDKISLLWVPHGVIQSYFECVLIFWEIRIPRCVDVFLGICGYSSRSMGMLIPILPSRSSGTEEKSNDMYQGWFVECG